MTPFFIVGCSRSGTTLLRECLDAHPNLCVGPETHILVHNERTLRRHWNNLGQFGWDRKYWINRFANFFSSFHEDHARAMGKKRWGDKTPGYFRILPFINELFPDALILQCVRDPYDVVASAQQRWGRRRAVEIATKWAAAIRECRKFSDEHPGRLLQVRYEQLVSRPDAVLRDVLDFLGEPWHEDIFQQHAENGQQQWIFFHRGERRCIFQSSVGQGRGKLSLPLRLLVRARAGALATELGYLK